MGSVVEPLALLPSVFTYGEARRRGLSDRQLYGLRDAGVIERLGRGLFRRSDAPGDPDLLEVAARAPESTLCLGTALARHDLTDEIPQVIDVALPRGRRQPAVEAPVHWRRFDPDTFDVGRRPLAVGELSMGIYSPERSICDAFRLRHREGHEQAVEALKRWLRRRGSQPAALLQIARQLSPVAEAPIREALKILL